MRTRANKNTCYSSIVLNYLTFKIPYAFRRFNLLFSGKISEKRGKGYASYLCVTLYIYIYILYIYTYMYLYIFAEIW